MFHKSSKFLIFCAMSLTTVAYGQSSEQINGWMHAHGKSSNYPYYEASNGCSYVPDKYANIVSFHGACDNHDECYMSIGSTKAECDSKFFDDLNYSCKRDLNGIGNALLPSCLAETALYEVGVKTLASLIGIWEESQLKQKEYLRTIDLYRAEIKAYLALSEEELRRKQEEQIERDRIEDEQSMPHFIGNYL